MLEFLGFGRTKTEAVDAGDTLPVTRPLPGDHPTATQREMVRMALHTLLKRHGIPAPWLGLELMARPTADEHEGILVQLTILHWHAGFGLYAPALQQELLDSLKRFDPSASHTKYQMHWKYAADCACPHRSLPEPSYWTAAEARSAPPAAALPYPPQAALQMQPMPTHRPKKFDLPSQPDDDDDSDNGFAATQMHDIR